MKPVIRCSQLPQLFRCPGSFVLQQRVQSRDSEVSYAGTYGHWQIAARLITDLGATPPPGGLPAPRVPANYKPGSFDTWLVDYCVAHARAMTPDDWSLEVEVPLAYEFDRFILLGHADRLATHPEGTEANGSDWKLGYRVVESADINDQVLGYIVLGKLALPQLRKQTFDIVQPRADEDDGEQRISTVTVEGDALDDAVHYCERKTNEALDNLDVIDDGPRQCRWCDAKLQCPATRARKEDMKMKLTPQALAEITATPNDEILAEWVIAGKVLDQAFKDAKELIHERLDAVKRINTASGLTITQDEQGGFYSVENPAGFYASLCATLPAEERAKVIRPKVTDLRDAIARVLNVPKTGKAAVTAKSVFEAQFMPHLKQGVKRIIKIS